MPESILLLSTRYDLSSGMTSRVGPEELVRLLESRRERFCAEARWILRDRCEAEDVVADIALQIWEGRVDFDARRGGAEPFLRMLVRSRAIDRVRRHGRRRHALLVGRWELVSEDSPGADPRGTLLDAAEPRELRPRLEALLAEISPERRRLIELHFFAGLSHRELAHRSGLPLGTVKSRLRRGLDELRRSYLGRYGVGGRES